MDFEIYRSTCAPSSAFAPRSVASRICGAVGGGRVERTLTRGRALAGEPRVRAIFDRLRPSAPSPSRGAQNVESESSDSSMSCCWEHLTARRSSWMERSGSPVLQSHPLEHFGRALAGVRSGPVRIARNCSCACPIFESGESFDTHRVAHQRRPRPRRPKRVASRLLSSMQRSGRRPSPVEEDGAREHASDRADARARAEDRSSACRTSSSSVTGPRS